MNMRNWTEHVRPRLSSLRLSPAREQEIVEELAQHLEDRWRELVAGGGRGDDATLLGARGAREDDATRLALAEFREGNLLAKYMAPLRQTHTPASITVGSPAEARGAEGGGADRHAPAADCGD